MMSVMLTKAQNSTGLDLDLQQWAKTYNDTRPGLILGSHELVYALAAAKDFMPGRRDKDPDKYANVPICCLCELWDRHNRDLECPITVDDD
jgi:hypothetical protein